MDCQYSVGEVWLQEFPFLKFRPLRQHPECATCIKFKCLLRSLGHHLVARQKQLEEYRQHLDSNTKIVSHIARIVAIAEPEGPAAP